MSERRAQIPWRLVGWGVGTWWSAHAALILGHVALVFLYSITVAPDRPPAEYSAFAERSGPWFSIVLGGPVFYVLGKILAKRVAPHGRAVALTTWALYTLCDLAIVLALGGAVTPLLYGQWVTSQTIKFVAVWVATRSESRH